MESKNIAIIDIAWTGIAGTLLKGVGEATKD